MFRLHTKLLDTTPHRVVQRRCGARVTNTLAMIGLIGALWLGSATTFAQVWTMPPGLNPGDKFRLVFVTNGTAQAVSSDIATYNTFVTSQASLNPHLSVLATTWTAIASTTSVNARTNTSTDPAVNGTGVPLFKFLYENGGYTSVKIADNYSDLWDGSIDSQLKMNQYGTELLSADGFSVWTGTTVAGAADETRAIGGSSQVRIGWVNESGPKWIYDIDQNNDSYRHFYAISGELTAVPEPGSLALSFALALAGAAWSARRRNRKAEPSASTASF